jgi:UrcA family protein
MTKNHAIARPLLALAAALIAAPLAAQDSTTVTGERQPVYQERVSFGDLDLSRAGEQRELRKRVRDASERVCIQAVGPITAYDVGRTGSLNFGMSCIDLTYSDARPHIAAAIASAKSGRQLAVSFVISAPLAR